MTRKESGKMFEIVKCPKCGLEINYMPSENKKEVELLCPCGSRFTYKKSVSLMDKIKGLFSK